MDEFELLLEVYSLEELFEELDLEPREVLEILYRHGYIELPTWLDNGRFPDEDEDEREAS